MRSGHGQVTEHSDPSPDCGEVLLLRKAAAASGPTAAASRSPPSARLCFLNGGFGLGLQCEGLCLGDWGLTVTYLSCLPLGSQTISRLCFVCQSI